MTFQICCDTVSYLGIEMPHFFANLILPHIPGGSKVILRELGI